MRCDTLKSIFSVCVFAIGQKKPKKTKDKEWVEIFVLNLSFMEYFNSVRLEIVDMHVCVNKGDREWKKKRKAFYC